MKNIIIIACIMMSSVAFSMDKEDMKIAFAVGQCETIRDIATYARALPPEGQEVIVNMIIAYSAALGVDVDTYAQFCNSIAQELNNTMTGTDL